jgi:hypothetical protein
MYAQMIETQLEPGRSEAVERVIRHELLAVLRPQPGFCGALNLTDRARSEILLVLLWETEEEAGHPLAARVASSPRASSTLTELLACGSCSVTIWEVDARS